MTLTYSHEYFIWKAVSFFLIVLLFHSNSLAVPINQTSIQLQWKPLLNTIIDLNATMIRSSLSKNIILRWTCRQQVNFTVRYHFNHTVLLRDFEKGFTNYKLINHTLEGFENNTVNILHIQLPIAKDTPSQVLYFAVRPFVTDVEVEANISNIASVWYPAYFSGRNIVYERIVISMVFLSVIGAITFVASVALVDKYRKSDHFHLDTNSCKYTEEVYLEGSQGSLRKSVLKKQSSSLTSY